jgi:hypothetical protein
MGKQNEYYGLLLVSNVLYALSSVSLVGFAGYRHARVSRFCRLEWKSFIIIALYMLIMFSKFGVTLFYLVTGKDSTIAKRILDTAYMTFDMCVWFLTYYFVFDMQEVADLTQCGDHIEYMRVSRNTRITRWAFLAFSTLSSLAYHVIAFIEFFQEHLSAEMILVSGISRALYVLCVGYMSIKWFRLITFFIMKKREKN